MDEPGLTYRVNIPPGKYAGATDAELSRAMVARDDGAWWEFDRRHARLLLSFIRVKLPSLSDEELKDVLQNALNRIARGLRGYEHRSATGFVSWCLAVAQSECLDELRRRADEPKHKELVSFEEIEATFARSKARPPEQLSASYSESDSDSMTEEEQIFRRAFGSLSPLDQAVLHLSLYSKDPDKLIAEKVGRPAGQIRMIRNKAKERLKRLCLKLEAQRRAS